MLNFISQNLPVRWWRRARFPIESIRVFFSQHVWNSFRKNKFIPLFEHHAIFLCCKFLPAPFLPTNPDLILRNINLLHYSRSIKQSKGGFSSAWRYRLSLFWCFLTFPRCQDTSSKRTSYRAKSLFLFNRKARKRCRSRIGPRPKIATCFNLIQLCRSGFSRRFKGFWEPLAWTFLGECSCFRACKRRRHLRSSRKIFRVRLYRDFGLLELF